MQEKVIIALLGMLGGMLPLIFKTLFQKVVEDQKLPIDTLAKISAAEEAMRADLMKQIEDLKQEIKELKKENKQLREENKKLDSRVYELEQATRLRKT